MRAYKQQGFTLLELLIVLSITMIVLSLSVPLATTLIEKKQEENFLNTFLYDTLFIQNESIGSNNYIRIVLNKDSYLIIGTENTTVERKLPAGWKLEWRTLKTISFNQNGSIRQAGTIQIVTNNTKYTITFPIGKGRGYIEKQ